MKNEQLSRAEKLHRLKQLAEGKATPKDFKPHHVFMWDYSNGIYTSWNSDLDLRLTEEEYQAFRKNVNTNCHHLIFKKMDGREPVND